MPIALVQNFLTADIFVRTVPIVNREAFIRELRRYGRENNLVVEINFRRGKGSHCVVTLGERFTTIPQGEIAPGTLRAIRRQLGIE